MRPRVAVFTDKIDWHVEAFARALARLGARPVAVRLAACKIDTTRPYGLAIPGFRAAPPDIGVVRAIGDGSLEAITMRLGVLHALGALGVPMVNDARAIERCTDKSMASFLLVRAGLRTPATFVAQNEAQARAIVRRECPHGPLVLKPLFGAQGWGLQLVRNEAELPSLQDARGVYYLQRFVEPRIVSGAARFEDMRVLISAGEIVGAMRRRSEQWITNVRQGARPVAVTPSARRGRNGAARRQGAGRGLRRRRSDRRRGRRPPGAGGQQHGRLERAAKGDGLFDRRATRRRRSAYGKPLTLETGGKAN